MEHNSFFSVVKLAVFCALIIGLLILLVGCGPRKPDYVKDGKEYEIYSHCVKSHTESDYGYHYGYNFLNGKYEWHWGTETTTICDERRTDTVEINLNEKYYK